MAVSDNILPTNPEAFGLAVGLSQLGCDGLLALRAFNIGEQIATEKPFAMVPEPNGGQTSALYQSLVDTGQSFQIQEVKDLWRGCPDGIMNEAYAQWAERQIELPEERAAAINIMLAIAFNAFSVKNGVARVLYRLISKANHSCAANAEILTDEDVPGIINCIRHIDSGSEILVSYLANLDLLLPISGRQELLHSRWEFECGCKRCRHGSDDSRLFRCVTADCTGHCMAWAPQSPNHDHSPPCDRCGMTLPAEIWQDFAKAEEKLEKLWQDLPDSLYSSWAAMEDFAMEHPFHGLSGRWKNYLAEHLRLEADTEDDPEEEAAMRKEAEEHYEAFQKCLNKVLHYSAE